MVQSKRSNPLTVVFRVIEHGARSVHLSARGAGAGVLDEAAARGQLPQLDDAVLAGRHQVLAVPRELDRAHREALVGLLERVDAAARHAVPHLEAAVDRARREHRRVGRPGDHVDGPVVLVLGHRRHETLGRVDVVDAHCDEVRLDQ